jgi:hypothetical protein
MMSIPSLSGSTISQAGQVSWQNNLAQRQQHLKELARALNAGDLTGAKTAFAALQQLQPNSSATIQTQNGQQGSVQNPLAPDYDALDKALKANNLQVAKEAFAKLLQNMQSLRQGHQRYAQQKVSTGKQGTTSTTYSPGVGLTAGSSGSAQNGAGGISLNIYA